MQPEYIGETRHRERMTADRFVCGVVGVELKDVGPGVASAELALEPKHLNGLGVCQGGVLFTLADYSIAAACNYAESPVVVGEASISFCKAGKTGKLFAEAREISRSRSTAVAEATIRDENGTLLCAARGRCFVFNP